MDDDEFVSKISDLTREFIKKHENDYDALQNELVIKQSEFSNLEKVVSTLTAKNADLLDTICKMEEDVANFKKVSQIIAYEKENSRLKKEIAELRNKLVIAPLPIQAPVQEELEVSFYEQTIKGKTYYITDDKSMLIYEKLANGDVGEPLGALVKNKPIWS
jgi:predicted  nucleic acid-binding Zn-ribbon protein